MTFHATAQALDDLGICAALLVCTLYVTKSTAQSAKEGEPPPRSMASQFRLDTATGA